MFNFLFSLKNVSQLLEAVDLLLTNGADINLTNCEGKTALALASDAQVIDLLKKHTKDFCIDDGDYFVDENDSD